MLDVDWSSSSVLQLYCDIAAGATLGCGCYLQGNFRNSRVWQNWQTPIQRSFQWNFGEF
jgi:hypothetical protein